MFCYAVSSSFAITLLEKKALLVVMALVVSQQFPHGVLNWSVVCDYGIV